MLFPRLLMESFISSLYALVENKLRTFLSLLGIVIGIFSIITVFTMVDALNKKISDSIATLGDKVIYVQKWPWEFGSDYPWWKYMNRPLPTYDEYLAIKERSQGAETVAMCTSNMKTLQFGSISMSNVAILAATEEYLEVANYEIGDGRFITDAEFAAGRPVAVIGVNVARDLFGNIDPIGKDISMQGRKIRVVGIFKLQGSNMFGNSADDMVYVPLNYGKTFMDIRRENANPFITVVAKEGVSNDALIDELEGIMRSLRRIKPRDEGNFALNQTSLLTKGFDSMFVIIYFAGGLIGVFSILVGGFGIANIMFVSVRERTNLIGIKKSLGAKNYYILLEFLFESVLLCLIGGLIGLFFIWLCILGANALWDLGVALDANNIIRGIFISVVIGLLAGIIPAFFAARLDPVEAIRSK